MPEGNHLGKAPKNLRLSADCRYFILCLANYMGASESGVVEEAVRQLYIEKLGPYEWDRPDDPRPRRKAFRVQKDD